MKKKGFTLIELLAVIIILAVIALIATPIILNVVDEAKEKARVSSVYGYAEAALLTQNENMLKDIPVDLKTGANAKMKGDPVTCKTVAFNSSYGALLDECTVGSNDTMYYFDGSKVLTVRPSDMDDRLAGASRPGEYSDASGASKPELVENMLPVIYKDNNWVYADITQKWYDYDAKEWANAVVLNSGVTKNVGDTIAESEIAMMYVWIPRYEYRIPDYNLAKTDSDIHAIDIKFIDSTKITANTGYSIHPGFTFNGTNKNGIWFGKFESSTTENVTSDNVQTIVIKPNVKSWRSVNVANMFTSSRNIQTTYGLTGVDTHMARYLEWTTAGYLTNSIYGRCSSAESCTDISRNDSSSCYTGRSDGTNGTGTGNSANGTYTYETANGQLASTTGNIYGIYDMSGGAGEYVMGVIANTSGIVYLGGNAIYPSGFIGNYGDGTVASSGITAPARQYYDVFTSTNTSTSNYSVLSAVNGNSSMNGVFKELLGSSTTNTMSWYSDYADFVSAGGPWFALGGYYGNNTNAGVFKSGSSPGNAHSGSSFRVVLLSN